MATIVFIIAIAATTNDTPAPFTLNWENDRFTISRPDLPGGVVEVRYLEAFCRANAHDADWSDTVIPHETVLIDRNDAGTVLQLRSTLDDGVNADHTIRAEADAVRFNVRIHNPGTEKSEAVWAQPCIRVGPFTGTGEAGAPASYDYLPQSFVFIDSTLTRMPMTPWAVEARYTPGQVWRAPDVPPEDVNPRPLNPVVPSNGLIGCFSADGKWILATAWEPWHELFQGVITCLHNDFHIGAIDPGETKAMRGAMYLFEGDEKELLTRYNRDFPAVPAGFRKKTFTLPDGKRMNSYLRPGEGPVLVLVPGTWGDIHGFARVIAELPADLPIAVIELCWQGGNVPRTLDMTMEECADDVLWVIDRLKLGRFYISGHSIGGMITVEIAGRDVPGLVGAIPMEGWTHHTVVQAAFAGVVTGELTPAQEAQRQADRNRGRGHLTEEQLNAIGKIWRNWNGYEALERSKVPLLHMWGDRGTAHPDRAALQIPERDSIEIRFIPGTSHSLMLEDPKAVAEAVAEFMRRQE